MSEQLIIVGFHRSGTSLTAQLLDRAGLFLGDELLRADESNRYGHYEDLEVKAIHEHILANSGLDWRVDRAVLPAMTERNWGEVSAFVDGRRIEHEFWGFKDPRVCMFLQVWKYVLPDAKFLAVYREPAGSVDSLKRRHSSQLFSESGPLEKHRSFFEQPDLAPRMWLVHNRETLKFAHAYPEDTMVASFEMIQAGFPLVWALNRRWNLGLKEVPTFEVFDPTATVSTGRELKVSDENLSEEIAATHRELGDLSLDTENLLKVGA